MKKCFPLSSADHLPLNLGDFPQSPHMSLFTTEPRIYKRPHNVQRQLNSYYSRAKAEHVAIIMFATLMRRIRVAAECCANPTQLVGSNCSTDATTANQDSNFRVAPLNRLANLNGVVRIIIRDRTIVGTEVRDFMTSGAKLFDHTFVQRKSAMVCADRDSNSHFKYSVLTPAAQLCEQIEK
jgi:hypothetical protein